MEKEIRPVAIDCANLACAYVYNANNLGDSLGPVSAYKYWKKLGHEVKVFVLQTKIYNKKNPERIMDNLDIFNREIEQKDRPIIPAGGDDDSYFIKWAVDNNAIMVTNDRLKDHKARLSGNSLNEFNNWLPISRCGFTFIDDQFFPDPNFSTFSDIDLIEIDGPSEEEEKDSLRERVKISAEDKKKILESDYEEISILNSELEKELSEAKSLRNDANSKWRVLIDKRNSINLEVAEKIKVVKDLKKKRNEHNKLAKELGKKRKLIDDELKKARKSLRSSHNQSGNPYPKIVKELEKKQNAAHQVAMDEVEKSDKKHTEMVSKSEEIDRLRNDANNTHQKAHRIKEMSDSFHSQYVEKLVRKIFTDQILRSLERDDSEISSVPSTLTRDLFLEKSEELSSEFDDILRTALSEYSPKRGDKQHIVDRIEHEYSFPSPKKKGAEVKNVIKITSSTGWFVGIIHRNRRNISELFSKKFGGQIVIRTSRTKPRSLPSDPSSIQRD